MADYDPPLDAPPSGGYERERDALPYQGGQQRGGGYREGQPENNKIYIGNINYKTSERDVEREFSRFGQVTDVHLPIDRDQGRPRGFAFVTFKDARDAEEALSMDGRDFDGRRIRCTRAEKKPLRNAGGPPPPSRPPRDEPPPPRGGGYGGYGSYDRGGYENGGRRRPYESREGSYRREYDDRRPPRSHRDDYYEDRGPPPPKSYPDYDRPLRRDYDDYDRRPAPPPTRRYDDAPPRDYPPRDRGFDDRYDAPPRYEVGADARGGY
mmetsp:Transcript_20321/g.62828  ORF Transcript_20321/g.62828 Transcript_20321/m.62828 type:complete len:266 (-) Transcript_20321:1431-2228(-)